MRGKLSSVSTLCYKLFEVSTKIICCDAFMKARTQNILKLFNGNKSIIFHKNEHHNIKRDLFIWRHNKCPRNIEETETAFVSKVIELLKYGKRLVCPCSSKSVIKDILVPSLIKAGYTNGDDFKVYYSDDINKDDKMIKADFSDANKAWNGLKLIAYSPIITIGTNNDTPDMFDQIVMFCRSSNSCCARDMI